MKKEKIRELILRLLVVVPVLVFYSHPGWPGLVARSLFSPDRGLSAVLHWVVVYCAGAYGNIH